MERSNCLAEVCGIHAGDGYLRNSGYKRELDVSGNLEEKSYYDGYVAPLFSRVFKLEVKTRSFPSRRTYGFVIRDKTAIENMHEVGFPYGKKSSIVRVPEFVMKSKNKWVKAAFLRGFFDTDGCLAFERKRGKYCTFKKTHHYYPLLILNTISGGLANDMEILLEELGLHFCRECRRPKQEGWKPLNRIWLRGTFFVEWMKLAGSKNPSKLSRYQIWKRYGHCPPNTTFAERLSILSGEIKLDHGPVW